VRRNKFSGDHFRRRYPTAPWQTFAATRPFSQITLGILVVIISGDKALLARATLRALPFIHCYTMF